MDWLTRSSVSIGQSGPLEQMRGQEIADQGGSDRDFSSSCLCRPCPSAFPKFKQAHLGSPLQLAPAVQALFGSAIGRAMIDREIFPFDITSASSSILCRRFHLTYSPAGRRGGVGGAGDQPLGDLGVGSGRQHSSRTAADEANRFPPPRALPY